MYGMCFSVMTHNFVNLLYLNITIAETTAASTTLAKTTAALTTAAPTTAGKTTTVSTTAGQSTAAPTTSSPSTAARSTNSRTTETVTTAAPTTESSTTMTTASFTTTGPPITEAPTTRGPQTITKAVPTKTEVELDNIIDNLSQPEIDNDAIAATVDWLVKYTTIPDDVTDRESYAQKYLGVCSDLINAKLSSFWTDPNTKVSASDVANACSSVIYDLAKSSDTNVIITTANIVTTSHIFPVASSFDGVVIESIDNIEVSISKEDFDQLGIDNDAKVSVCIISYKNGELITGRSGDSNEIATESAPVSVVVAITLFADSVKTSLPVRFTLTIDKEQIGSAADDKEPTCMYQKTDGTGLVNWVSDGCETTGSTETSITCYCKHTTNFAILMQVKDVKLSYRDEIALNWITYICCSLSIVALLITLVVLLTLRSSLRSERVTIHVNLVIALILAQALLLLSTPAAATETMCRAVAIMLHYFFTAVFCWMLVEGIHLYLQIVRVFSTGKDRLISYLLVGWGTPLLIVAITAGIRWYGYGDNGRCWLSTAHGMVWAFVAPALLIIAINFVILIMVLRILVVSAKSSDDDYGHIKAGLKGAVLLLPLLGVTWLFGVISISAHTVVFLYLFSIFNSLQGVFIFLMYCVFNAEVRNAVNRHKEKRALTRGDMVSTMDNVSDSKSRSKANRIHPDSDTKETQMVDIQSTTTTTTHTQMLIRRQPGQPDEVPVKGGASIADVD